MKNSYKEESKEIQRIIQYELFNKTCYICKHFSNDWRDRDRNNSFGRCQRFSVNFIDGKDIKSSPLMVSRQGHCKYFEADY